MFPPLCFVDISHGIADGDSHMEEEMVDSESGDETQVVYKLKIVEWWEKAKEIFNPYEYFNWYRVFGVNKK